MHLPQPIDSIMYIWPRHLNGVDSPDDRPKTPVLRYGGQYLPVAVVLQAWEPGTPGTAVGVQDIGCGLQGVPVGPWELAG